MGTQPCPVRPGTPAGRPPPRAGQAVGARSALLGQNKLPPAERSWVGRPESVTSGWLCRAARPRSLEVLGPRALRPPQPSLPWTLPLLLFRVRPTSRGSHHPGKGCCDLHPSPWVCRGSTPRRGGLGVSACGRGRWPREGTAGGQRRPAATAGGPWELRAEQRLPLALQAPCRLPARPPSCGVPPLVVLGAGLRQRPCPGPRVPQGSTTHSCACV